MSVKTVGLLSGGLDSALATRIMQKLGFDVTALNFFSPFCTCTSKSHGCKNEAKRLAEELGMKVRVEFMGQEYIDLVRNPKFGYGKNINPCVDCRIMIFKRAKQVMEEIGAGFIFTGEVVGQRPMSQRSGTMALIDKESGLSGLVVRPMCAQLLPPTIPEKEGIIDRGKMLAIQGRSRKEQIRVAKEDFGMTENLCSSGGCLLTDPHFAGRMRDLIDNDKSAGVKDARLLRVGRHFRLSGDLKVIVGRNHEENNKLEKMADQDDFFFYPASVDAKGALTVARGSFGKESVEKIIRIAARYCKDADGGPVRIRYRRKSDDTSWVMSATPATEKSLEAWRV